MLDFIKRICIALALAVFIGMLFLGTTTTLAAEDDLPNEMVESLIWPTVGEMTDTYGTRDGKHYGIDLAAPEGTPVITIASGVVSRSYESDTYGQVIFIEHDNGLETVYAHLNHRAVKEGQVLKEGELIGTVGNTGRSSGSHLHFEVHSGNWNPNKTEAIDPLIVLSNDPKDMYVALSGEIGPNIEFKQDDAITVMSETEQPHNEQFEEEVISNNEQNHHFIDTVHVTIQSGDTLWSIANHFQVTVDELMEWNFLQSDEITKGSVLVVYPTEANYVVQKGDTITKIASIHGVSQESIIKMNDLASDLIFPGQTLYVNK